MRSARRTDPDRRTGHNVLFLRECAPVTCYTFFGGLAQEVDNAIRAVPHASRRRLCTMGLSSGGFAALAYGCRYNAQRVCVIAPQTDVSTEFYASLEPHQQPERCGVLRCAPNPDVFPERIVRVTCDEISERIQERVFVLYARRNMHDTAHVTRICGAPNVQPIAYDTADHVLAAFSDHVRDTCVDALQAPPTQVDGAMGEYCGSSLAGRDVPVQHTGRADCDT